MDSPLTQLLDWVTERRFELIAVVWALLVCVRFLGRWLIPSRAKRFSPGLVALGITPPAVTVLLWPAARWPFYRDEFFEATYQRRFPPLDSGLSTLLYHPGYIVTGLIALYAVVSAATKGAAPLPRTWGYAAIIALYFLEELVFFKITVVE